MKKVLAGLIIGLFYYTPLLAISEENFKEDYAQNVFPYYLSGEFGYFYGVDNIKLQYVKYEIENEKGALVILHGKSESYIKYAELIYDLKYLGYSFYLMDHRGMGFSERRLKDDTEKVHVRDFNNYVEDFKTFIDKIVGVNHNKLFLIAHSMGGTISTLYLERYPDVFDAAVLSSPMLEINSGEFPEVVAYIISSLYTAFGLGEEYTLGQGPRETGTFEENLVTHSYARWSVWEEDLIPDNPTIRSGGVTNLWVKESIEATFEAQVNAHKITVPFLLFQADEDFIVKPEGQDRVCAAAQHCLKIFIDKAKHEILMEEDEIRGVAIDHIIDFIESSDNYYSR